MMMMMLLGGGRGGGMGDGRGSDVMSVKSLGGGRAHRPGS